jgi:hypothetical protein
MAQHEQLDVLGGGRATQQQEQPEQVLKDQYSRRNDPAAIMPGRWRSLIAAGQRHVQDSGTPQANRAPPHLLDLRCRWSG